jgi:hypothetical protein
LAGPKLHGAVLGTPHAAALLNVSRPSTVDHRFGSAFRRFPYADLMTLGEFGL